VKESPRISEGSLSAWKCLRTWLMGLDRNSCGFL